MAYIIEARPKPIRAEVQQPARKSATAERPQSDPDRALVRALRRRIDHTDPRGYGLT